MNKKITLFLFGMIIPAVALAEKTAVSKPGFVEQVIPFVLIAVVFYFLLIRPNQIKFKNHKEFLTTLKRGDEVLTQSGIFGTVEGITDQYIILEIAEDTKIRILKTQISSLATTANDIKTT